MMCFFECAVVNNRVIA